MLHFGPYFILKKDSSIHHLKKVKCHAKKFVMPSGQTKHMVILSIVNCSIFYIFSEIHKLTLAFRPIVSKVGTDFDKLVPSFRNFLLTVINFTL